MKIPKDKTIILFDGVCNFCNGSVNFIIKRDKKNRFLFAPLQSDFGKEFLSSYELSSTDLDSVIVFHEGKVLQKSQAALAVTSHLGFLWPMLSIFKIFPTFILDFFYDFIARNRYRFFGKKDACMIPTPEVRAKFLG
jgi:predicted DCC family thiol-disulfide oxidoreductase YuxK